MLTELIMPPNIKPISGTKITSFTRILLRICKKIRLPKRAKKEAINTCVRKLEPAKNIMLISMPNFAQSIVPAVVGETNLF